MKLYHSEVFVLPLPPGHRFPMEKYARLRERVAAELVPPHELVIPPAASDADLLRVHTADWVRAVTQGTLSPAQTRRIGFPWSPALVERSRRSVGATIAASRAALDAGLSVNLAGGTHHAWPDRGEGFCVFNDVAVAACTMQAEGRVRRIAVIDTDVHQGDGTAFIFRNDPTVFTFSVHGASNFPFRKQPGDLDIGLADGAGDGEFLDAVAQGMEAALAHGPDLLYYLAGADAHEGDRLGRLRVSMQGMAQRDKLVLGASTAHGIPVVVVMGGGYGRSIEDVVAIHYATVERAARVASARAGAAEATSR